VIGGHSSYLSQLLVYGRKQNEFTFVVSGPDENYQLPSKRAIAGMVKKIFGQEYVELSRSPTYINFTLDKLNNFQRNVLLTVITNRIKFRD
jgi:hypothetical protein